MVGEKQHAMTAVLAAKAKMVGLSESFFFLRVRHHVRRGEKIVGRARCERDEGETTVMHLLT
jgi:hypothetical protein